MHGSPYFSPKEFACKCGCAFGTLESHIAADLVIRLHVLRQKLAIPFVLTSAARCEAHNTKVGGGAKSTHKAGVKGQCTPGYEGQSRAADVDTQAWSTDLRGRAVALALALGLRVGISTAFLHLDVEQLPYYSIGLWNYGAGENSSG